MVGSLSDTAFLDVFEIKARSPAAPLSPRGKRPDLSQKREPSDASGSQPCESLRTRPLAARPGR